MTTICGTSVTLDAVVAKLQHHFDTKATIVAHEEEVIGLQQGFLSKVVRIFNIKWSGDEKEKESRLPASFVLKIPTIDNYAALTSQLENETAQQLQQIVEEHDIVRKVMPNRNKADDKPTDPASFLILEDLSEFVTGDMMDGLTEEQMNQLAEVLADMQAWSVRNAAQWMGNVDMDVDPNVGGFTDKTKIAEAREMFKTTVKGDKWLHELFGYKLTARIDDLVGDDAMITSFVSTVQSKHFPNTKLPIVMVHSDCHPFNALFAKNSDGSASNVLRALLDWQSTYAGYPTSDLLRMVMSSADGTMRTEYFPRVFDKWYARLVGNLGEEFKMKCSKADLWKLYEIEFYYKQCVAVPLSPKIATMKDGAIKGLIAERDNPRFMIKSKRAMIDALEIKERLQLH